MLTVDGHSERTMQHDVSDVHECVYECGNMWYIAHVRSTCTVAIKVRRYIEYVHSPCTVEDTKFVGT